MLPRRTLPGFLLGVLMLAACQQGADSEKEDDTPAIPVETATATRGDIYAMYSGTAPMLQFLSMNDVAIMPRSKPLPS